MKRLGLGLGALLWALSLPCQAADFGSAGTAGADFLKVPLSARATGMGGAWAALSDDLSALELNPAGLAQLDGAVLSGGHLSYFEGIGMDHLGIGWGGGKLGLGLMLQSLSTPEIEGTDALGRSTGSFSQNDRALQLGLGAKMSLFTAGLSGRYFSRSLAGLSQSGISADLGLGLGLKSGFHAALVMQNLGSLSALESASDPAPLLFRGALAWRGEAYEASRLSIELDGVQPWDSRMQLRLGAELNHADLFFMRLGGQWSEAYDRLQTFSAGVGARYRGLQLDYSYVPFSALGTAHRFSLTALFKPLLHPRSRPLLHGLPIPKNLKVTLSGQTALAEWEAPAEGEASGYMAYVRKGGAELVRVTAKPLSKPRLSLKDLAQGKIYGLAVTAVDKDGKEGKLSSEIKFNADEGSREILGPPQAPQGLKAVRKGGEIFLTWQASESPGQISYQAYVKVNKALAPVAGGKSSIPALILKAKDFRPGETAFVVKALRTESGQTFESDFSEEAPVAVKH